MKRKKLIFFMIGIVLLIIIGCATVYASEILNKKGSFNWYLKQVRIENSDISDTVKKTTCSNKDCSIYDLNYGKAITKKINKMLTKNEYTLDNPLFIYNPYGTNTTSINVYFNTDIDVKVSYTIHVDDENIKDYSNILNSGSETTKEHAYQIIGFIPGMKNSVTITLLDSEGVELDKKTWEVSIPELDSSVDTNLEVTEGESLEALSDGLYSVLGHDKNFNSNIYLYDNNGILRSELTLDSYRSDRILFIDNYMVYAINNRTIVFANRLGQIEKTYDLTDDYKMHHDFIYNEAKNSLLILANKKNTESIEDRIINLNLETGEVTELVDMRDYFTLQYESAKEVGGTNAYGGDEYDWIHLNSITLVNDSDVIVSARELSLIIRINDIYENPSISYTLGDSTVLEGTDSAQYNYTKIGEFVDAAGQHSVTYIEDDSLEEGQYYLILYNNNYKVAKTRPDYDWSNYPGAGTYNEGEKSMFYKYLIDENEKTYRLVDEIDLPYSSIVSSVEYVDSNIVTSSGKSNCYEEYDKDGILIRRFTYSAEKYAYRVFKYSYHNFWFTN